MSRAIRLLLCVLGAQLLAGCSPPEPIRLGYIGTLSGRSADFGLSGRNGTLLAVEQINASGGIKGRPITLLVRDDEQNTAAATRAVENLAAEHVVAIIGPMTSSMAFDLAPVADRIGTLLVSPTATADELTGRDDNLLRLASPTSAHARLDAEFQYQRQGRRRIAALIETGNPVYTEGYIKEFRAVFTAQGGVITTVERFAANEKPDLQQLIKKLTQTQPDALLFVANAVDTARLAQHARQQQPELPLIGCAWAGTEELIQLGGRAIEGMYVGQYFDRDHPAPEYQKFRHAYESRFNELPGFGSTIAYDATRSVAEALRRKDPDQTLKNALLKLGPFTGTQQDVSFDRFGDSHRPSHITVVRNGRLVAISWP